MDWGAFCLANRKGAPLSGRDRVLKANQSIKKEIISKKCTVLGKATILKRTKWVYPWINSSADQETPGLLIKDHISGISCN